MGRAWREEYNGEIYHVIARVNNKEYIFKEIIDKGCFIKLLKENEVFKININSGEFSISLHKILITIFLIV